MAQQKSGFLSALGVMWEIWKALVNAVLDLGGSDDDLRRIQTDKELRRKLAELIVGATRKVFRLVVNYDESVETLVKRGKYDWTNDSITSKNFPTKRTGTSEVVVELVYLNRAVSTDEALAELDRMGFRPAELKELLVLGAEQPELQREFPIVALGSVWQYPDGDRRCAYLGRYADGRDLDLYWLGRDWYGHCRFAAVRK